MSAEITFPARVWYQSPDLRWTSRPETKQDRAGRNELVKSLNCSAIFRGTIEGSSQTNKVIDLLQNLSEEEKARIREVFKS